MSQNLLFISTPHISEYLFRDMQLFLTGDYVFKGEDTNITLSWSQQHKSLCLELEIDILNHHHLLSWGNYYQTRIQTRARLMHLPKAIW